MSTITSFTLPTSLRALAPGADKRYHVYPLVSGKNKKKKRWIEAPDSELKAAQRWLLDNWLYHLPPTGFAHGFVPGRSILTNAAEHVGRRWVVTADVRDFFPSITARRIATCLAELELDAADRSTVGQLVTRRGRLPQGAPTSPHLANLVARTLDLRLSGLARQHDWTYTRYADDLTFTATGELSHEFLERAIGCVLRAGFEVNRRKIKRYTVANADLVICGIRLHDGRLTLPRRVLRKYRALLFQTLACEPEEISDGARQHVHGAIGFRTMATTVCPPQLEQLLEAVLRQHGSWLRPGTTADYFPSYGTVSQ